jgi:GT2 family glycosyltransferase
MLYAVVVLYKNKISESKTIISLNKIVKNNLMIKEKLKIIIYDNSPDYNNDFDFSKADYIYISDNTNGGLSKAYNEAIKIAITNNAEWLITLDQDTYIEEDFLIEAFNVISNIGENVVAIVPKIIGQNKHQISPMYINKGYIHTLKPVSNFGITNEITAINSAAIINVDYVSNKGGYNTEFKIDMLDHWLFYEIRKDGKETYVLNTNIFHELSVLDYDKLVTVERYKSILKSEKLFFSKYYKKDIKAYKRSLLLRAIKQRLLIKNKGFSRLTYNEWLNFKLGNNK